MCWLWCFSFRRCGYEFNLVVQKQNRIRSKRVFFLVTITFHIFSWYLGSNNCSFKVRSSRNSVVLSFSFGLFLNVVAFSPFGELLESFFIFLNRYVLGFVKINREFINPSLTCLIKQQLKQLNSRFLMNESIVYNPMAIEQMVPNFSKEEMTWFFSGYFVTGKDLFIPSVNLHTIKSKTNRPFAHFPM